MISTQNSPNAIFQVFFKLTDTGSNQNHLIKKIIFVFDSLKAKSIRLNQGNMPREFTLQRIFQENGEIDQKGATGWLLAKNKLQSLVMTVEFINGVFQPIAAPIPKIDSDRLNMYIEWSGTNLNISLNPESTPQPMPQSILQPQKKLLAESAELLRLLIEFNALGATQLLSGLLPKKRYEPIMHCVEITKNPQDLALLLSISEMRKLIADLRWHQALHKNAESVQTIYK